MAFKSLSQTDAFVVRQGSETTLLGMIQYISAYAPIVDNFFLPGFLKVFQNSNPSLCLNFYQFLLTLSGPFDLRVQGFLLFRIFVVVVIPENDISSVIQKIICVGSSLNVLHICCFVFTFTSLSFSSALR